MFRRWLDRYDRWWDGHLEVTPRRGRKFVLPFPTFPFPPRKLPPTEYISYLSLTKHALSFSLSYVLTYSLIVVVGVVFLLLHLVVQPILAHHPHASHHAQQKFVLLLLKLLLKSGHRYIIGFIWQQVEVGLTLFAFAFLLDLGTLRAWNRRARRLRLNPDVPAPPLPAPPGVWPPPPTN